MNLDTMKENINIYDANDSVSKAFKDILSKRQAVIKFKENYYFVSKRDLMHIGIDFSKTKLKKYMHYLPVLQKAKNIFDIVKHFIETNASYIPVLENNDVVFLSRDKVLLNIAEDLKDIKIEQAMSKNLYIVSPETTLLNVLANFRDRNISKALVFDKSKLLGVVSLTKILNFSLENDDRLNIDVLKNTSVKKIMKKDIIAMPLDKSLREAIKKMIDSGTSSLIAMDEAPKGIISKIDILQSFFTKNKKNDIVVQIYSKIKPIPKELIEKKISNLSRILKNDSDIFVFVHISFGTERYKSLPLVNCRLRLQSSKNSEVVSVDGWGIDNALELAIRKLKRILAEKRSKK